MDNINNKDYIANNRVNKFFGHIVCIKCVVRIIIYDLI